MSDVSIAGNVQLWVKVRESFPGIQYQNDDIRLNQ